MRLGGFIFRPAFFPTLATLLVLPVLIALGVWQLDRAHQKKVFQTAFQIQTALPAVSVTAVDLTDPRALYRRVKVKGHYDSGHQILLDNKIMDGQPGYHVFTPLWLPGGDRAILVNRGWVALGDSRERLPNIAVTDANIVLTGRVGQPANPGLRLDDTASASTWPRVVQYVDYETLSTDLSYPLAPAVILLDPESPSGYRREWRPSFAGFGPERHQGYAVQWFALAVTLMVIYIAVNLRRSDTAD